VLLASGERYLGVGTIEEREGVSYWLLEGGQELPLSAVRYWASLTSVALFKGNFDGTEAFDEDGYPTQYALETLQNWPGGDPVGWLKLAQTLWYWGGRAFELSAEGDSWKASASTGGWSGNESVIAAMEKNSLLWHTARVSSTRGGHFTFEAKLRD
jgi:hypothetical protein